MEDDMTLELKGIHHLTAITAKARENVAFYTGTLGMRLIKKTVNQDDTSAYHLFYADGVGSPGTDITFFDWPVGRERRGGNSVTRTGLRVSGAAHDPAAGHHAAADACADGDVDADLGPARCTQASGSDNASSTTPFICSQSTPLCAQNCPSSDIITARTRLGEMSSNSTQRRS